MRRTCLILAAVLVLAPLPSVGADSARDDGFVARIEVEGAIATAAGSAVLVPPEDHLHIRVQVFEGDWRSFEPYDENVTVRVAHAEINDGTGLPRFNEMTALERRVKLDEEGKAKVFFPEEHLQGFEGFAPGNALLISARECFEHRCKTSYHSWSTNLLIDQGMIEQADVLEYQEPNSETHVRATPVYFLEG